MKKHVFMAVLLGSVALGGCGTTYVIPQAQEGEIGEASRMFAEARAEGPRRQLSVSAAEQRFRRVARRVSPAGKQVCEASTAEIEDFDCDVVIGIDRELNQRNAYFTYAEGKPQIRISMPLLRDTESDDEVAFVLSHEYGHLIGRHLEKQQQQAIVGALVLGTIAVAANASISANGGYADPNLVGDSVRLGAAAGQMAYSQTYELESDTLGTYIARQAGYDPVKDAEFFARPEEARAENGKLSFWGTHPPDEKRLATVLATMRDIDTHGHLILRGR